LMGFFCSFDAIERFNSDIRARKRFSILIMPLLIGTIYLKDTQL
jgi:hypothetical protein